MMCDSPEELREAAQWAGKGTKSRQDLMDKLQGMYKPPEYSDLFLNKICALVFWDLSEVCDLE